jgi:hypothetical protein
MAASPHTDTQEKPTMSTGIDIAQFAKVTWGDVCLRHQALPHLDPHVLLHAGPPLAGVIPHPIRNAAIQAILYEGAASDVQTAAALLESQQYLLRPAQDVDVVTPLAQVVSHSMPLAVAKLGNVQAYGALVEGGPPALRFGVATGESCAQLARIADIGCRLLAPGLQRQPVSLYDIVAFALDNGDECHSRTSMANQCLADMLATSAYGIDVTAILAIRKNPGFVLPILMAAAKAVLLSAGDQAVHSVGGNGIHFGLRLKGETSWRTIDAAAPIGTRFPNTESTIALGAIGDSAVIDYAGLGAQALAAAPDLCKEWGSLLPADALHRRSEIVDPSSGLVAPARVLSSGKTPLVNLAILDLDGAQGLIGRGFFIPDNEAFRSALQ